MDAPEGCGYTIDHDVPNGPCELVPIEAGYVFDLGGGHELEVFAHEPEPARPAASACWRRSAAVLFTGDSLVRTPTLIFFGQGELCTVEAFHEHLLPLQARKGEFDALYPGHFETPQPVELLDDMVTLSGLDPAGAREVLLLAGHARESQGRLAPQLRPRLHRL